MNCCCINFLSQRGNRRYQTSPAMCNPSLHFAANNRLVQCLQSSVCPCRVLLHGPVQFAIIRSVRLVGHMFSPKLLLPHRGSSPYVTHCSLGQAHLSFQTASRLVQPFLYGSQMLCCTVHSQWRKKLQKLPLPLGISSPRWKRTDPRPEATCTQIC